MELLFLPPASPVLSLRQNLSNYLVRLESPSSRTGNIVIAKFVTQTSCLNPTRFRRRPTNSTFTYSGFRVSFVSKPVGTYFMHEFLLPCFGAAKSEEFCSFTPYFWNVRNYQVLWQPGSGMSEQTIFAGPFMEVCWSLLSLYHTLWSPN